MVVRRGTGYVSDGRDLDSLRDLGLELGLGLLSDLSLNCPVAPSTVSAAR